MSELTRWIPVSERLPDTNRSVIAFVQKDNGRKFQLMVQYYEAKSMIMDFDWAEEGWYDEERGDYFYPTANFWEVMEEADTSFVIENVTHWRDLEKNPGEENYIVTKVSDNALSNVPDPKPDLYDVFSRNNILASVCYDFDDLKKLYFSDGYLYTKEGYWIRGLLDQIKDLKKSNGEAV